MSESMHWNERYEKDNTPWETGQPSSELQRVLAEFPIRPCRAVELGCGTGANAVWLAQQGFEVTALDLSPLAIARARNRPEGETEPVAIPEGVEDRPERSEGEQVLRVDVLQFPGQVLADDRAYRWDCAFSWDGKIVAPTRPSVYCCRMTFLNASTRLSR